MENPMENPCVDKNFKDCDGYISHRCQPITARDDEQPILLSQLIQKMVAAPPLVEYRDGQFIFYDDQRRPYTIDAWRANTPTKLLAWIAHMTEKVWVSGLHIHQFVMLAAQQMPRIKIDYSA